MFVCTWSGRVHLIHSGPLNLTACDAQLHEARLEKQAWKAARLEYERVGSLTPPGTPAAFP